MKLSRRGILASLIATGAAPFVALEEKPDLPKQTFIKGMIIPRTAMVPDYGGHRAPARMMTIEYDIYDGEKFVSLNSDAGQRVVRELS